MASAGPLTGIALVGYLKLAGELVGSPAFLFNPKALACLNLLFGVFTLR